MSLVGCIWARILGHSLIVVDVIDFQIQKEFLCVDHEFIYDKQIFKKTCHWIRLQLHSLSLMLSKLCAFLDNPVWCFLSTSFNSSLQHQMLRTTFHQGKVVDGSGIQALPRKILNHTKQIYHFTSMVFQTSKPCQTNYAILLEENMKKKKKKKHIAVFSGTNL